MRHILAGLMGLFLTSALSLAAQDMGWHILAAGMLLFFGVKVASELAAIEKKRDELKNMELVGSGTTSSFEMARLAVLSLIETTKRDGRVITNIFATPSGTYTWDLYREKDR